MNFLEYIDGISKFKLFFFRVLKNKTIDCNNKSNFDNLKTKLVGWLNL